MLWDQLNNCSHVSDVLNVMLGKSAYQVVCIHYFSTAGCIVYCRGCIQIKMNRLAVGQSARAQEAQTVEIYYHSSNSNPVKTHTHRHKCSVMSVCLSI